MDPKIKNISTILRLSLGFAFIYAGISHYLSPEIWLQFYPAFMQDIATQQWFLVSSSIGEVVFGLLIISGYRTYYLAILSALGLAGIVVFNLDNLFTVFRDVSLVGASLALAMLHKSEQ